KEPFKTLRHQGMVLGEYEITAYRDAKGERVSARDVREEETTEGALVFHKRTGEQLTVEKLSQDAMEKKGNQCVEIGHREIAVDVRAHKMSKSRGNVVNPDDMVAQHSADALRLYEMFMGDFEQPKPWDPKAVMGVVRFLQNVWRVVEEPKPAA